MKDVTPQLSVAVGTVQVTGTVHPAPVPVIVMLAGIPLINGDVVSNKFIVCVHELDNPVLGSVATKVLNTTCELAQDPLEFTTSDCVIVGTPVHPGPALAVAIPDMLVLGSTLLGQDVNVEGQNIEGAEQGCVQFTVT